MSSFRVQVLREAQEDVLLQLSGSVGPKEVLREKVYSPTGAMTARVDGVLYAVEDGLTCRFLWDGEKPTPFLPLSGRGMLDCSKFGSLHNPREVGFNGGISIEVRSSASDERVFSFSLDLSKQRS